MVPAGVRFLVGCKTKKMRNKNRRNCKCECVYVGQMDASHWLLGLGSVFECRLPERLSLSISACVSVWLRCEKVCVKTVRPFRPSLFSINNRAIVVTIPYYKLLHLCSSTLVHAKHTFTEPYSTQSGSPSPYQSDI